MFDFVYMEFSGILAFFKFKKSKISCSFRNFNNIYLPKISLIKLINKNMLTSRTILIAMIIALTTCKIGDIRPFCYFPKYFPTTLNPINKQLDL